MLEQQLMLTRLHVHLNIFIEPDCRNLVAIELDPDVPTLPVKCVIRRVEEDDADEPIRDRPRDVLGG
jgi:hypothetical protein